MRFQLEGKLFKGIIIVLSAVVVLLFATLITEVADYQYDLRKEEEYFLYRIKDGDYEVLPEHAAYNRILKAKETPGLLECYAIADYYEAAFRARTNPNLLYEEEMEEAREKAGALGEVTRQIDRRLDVYLLGTKWR